MAKVMEKRFANWQGQSFDEATLEPSDLAEAMMEYCCRYYCLLERARHSGSAPNGLC